MNTYVALLRGVNLAGRNRLPMKELAEVLTAAGYEQVRTYIQSGNAVFRAAQVTPQALSAMIEGRFGFRVPVVLRTAQQMRTVASSNPFTPQNPGLEDLHVVFLSAKVEPGVLDDVAFQRFAPDTFSVSGQDLYLSVPTGFGKSKFPAYLDARLKAAGIMGTTRNWRTTLKLNEMAAEASEL